MGSTPDERYHRARDFARERKIDLASAYSVLLGIIPIEKALSIPQDESYDRGFSEAIDEGFLTAQQAVERGDRVLYASTLAQRHGLPMGLAFLVTDNRMRLSEALAQHSGALPPAVVDPHNTRALWNVVLVGVAAIVGAVLFAILQPKQQPAVYNAATAATAGSSREPQSTTPDPQPPPPKPAEAVVYKTDAQGRVVEVSGPDPKTVLVGLCAHEQFARALSPIGVTPAVPPSAGDRLGFVRDMSDLSAERCVAIHRDSSTGRWFAGDGRDPLEIQRAPALPPGTPMTPL